MEFNDVREYFKTYVKKYTPYLGDRVYNVLVDYILEQYLNDSYTVIPEGFKALYEDNILSESIYNQLLFAVGVHDEVIKKMRVNDKKTFISALSAFQRYKGSVKLFRNIGAAYKDRFNVYELYVDNADGQWILRPYIIYEGVKNKKNPPNIPYIWAYETIPTLFVSPEQLDYYKSNNLAAFPLKTNIISLQYSMEIYCSEMITLSLKTFLKEYGSTYITIYHRDNTFSLQLKHIYYIWTYILAKYYAAGFYNARLTKMLLYSDEANPYNLQDVDDLWKEYDKLEYSADLYEFYKEHLSSVFETFHKAEELTPDDMSNIVSSINKQYYEYIISRLEDQDIGADKTKRMNVFNEFTNEIYDSLLLYQDNKVKTQTDTTNNSTELFLKYFDMLLNSLSHIIVDPKDTVSYLLMYNFKPYHTEFLTEASSAIVIDDKFNSIAPKDEQEFLFDLIKADYLDSMMDYIHDFRFIFTTNSNQEQIDAILHYLDYSTTDDESKDMDDYIKNFKFLLNLINVKEVSDGFINKLNIIKNSNLAPADGLNKLDFDFNKLKIDYDKVYKDKLNINHLLNKVDIKEFWYKNIFYNDFDLIEGNLNVNDDIEVIIT